MCVRPTINKNDDEQQPVDKFVFFLFINWSFLRFSFIDFLNKVEKKCRIWSYGRC